MNDLIPRKPKRKRQPTAEMMREQLRLAADEIIRLRTEHEWFEKHTAAVVWNFPVITRLRDEIAETPWNELPWWARLFKWRQT